jgi:hypothetical protein
VRHRTSSWLLAMALAAAACSDAPGGPNGTETCSTRVALQRGDIRQLADPRAMSCIAIVGGQAASEYLVITANASRERDDLHSYMVRTRDGSAGADRASESTSSTIVSPEDATRERMESRVRESERRLLATRSLANVALRPKLGGSSERTPDAVRVGDTLSFHVPDASTDNLCANYVDVRAVVKAISASSIVALDVAAPPRGFTDVDFGSIADEFDSLILPTDQQWFGAPTDVNGDGHITILYTPRINRLTPTGSLGYVGGFFVSSDLLPRSNPAQNWTCPSSNEQEIFYLLAPDPDGTVNGNRFSLETTRESSRGTTAHELQHMINQGVRQTVTRSDRLEVAWLNEGLSHFAEELVGRASRGYADNKKLTWDDVLFELDDFDSFFRQNLLRLRLWLDRPDLWSPTSGSALTQLAPRGAAWAFLRYSTDQYGGSNARAFVRSLAAGPEVDIANLEARTQANFADIVSGFLVASFADSTISSMAPRYSFASWSMRDVMTNLNGGEFPLRTRQLPSADVVTSSPSGSGNYFVLSLPAGSPMTTLRVLSTLGGSVDFAGARVYVARLK